MAEGGGDDGDGNPFSFKNFVHSKDKNSAPARNNEMDRSTEENDIFASNEDIVLPENSPPVISSSQPTGASALQAGEEQPKPKKKSSDGNPFSFKKFLAHSGSKTRWQAGLANDLPDFVQDHYTGDLTRDLRTTRDLDLPDFTLTRGGNRNETNDFHNSDNLDNNPASRDRSSVTFPDAQTWNEPTSCPLDSDDIFSHNAEVNGVAPQLASSLPDFLSDGAFSNSGDISRHPPITVQVNPGREVAALEINGDLELELRRLRDENREIRRQLTEAQHLAATQANRVNQVLKEMETTQKREKDETEALEKMVQQVEANLETTTQRAIKAESLVSKLKQEVKLLQKQLQVIQSENEVLRSGDVGMMHLRQQTLSASEQLSVAATSAEQSLRQLLGGVDTLRILSAVLASTDKITEEGRDNQKGDT